MFVTRNYKLFVRYSRDALFTMLPRQSVRLKLVAPRHYNANNVLDDNAIAWLWLCIWLTIECVFVTRNYKLYVRYRRDALFTLLPRQSVQLKLVAPQLRCMFEADAAAQCIVLSVRNPKVPRSNPVA